jgi:acetylglutamate kinase
MAFLKDNIFKGKLLAEAMSHMRKFAGETFVIKYGGIAMGDPQKIKNFASDIVLLKNCGIEVIVVHGAGPKVGKILENLKVESSFVEGVRIATKENIDLIEMILTGHVNKQLVSEINAAGGVALGFSGKDASLMMATKIRKTKKETDSIIERIVDFGYLGMPTKINTEIFEVLSESQIIPVISPVGFDDNGNTFVINADNVAGVIASAIRAHRLILMTEYEGLIGEDGVKISSLSQLEAESLKKSKIIKGNMLSKLEVCLEALKHGVSGAHLINSGIQHALLLEILTKERIGTLIFNNETNTNHYDFEFDDI